MGEEGATVAHKTQSHKIRYIAPQFFVIAVYAALGRVRNENFLNLWHDALEEKKKQKTKVGKTKRKQKKNLSMEKMFEKFFFCLCDYIADGQTR